MHACQNSTVFGMTGVSISSNVQKLKPVDESKVQRLDQIGLAQTFRLVILTVSFVPIFRDRTLARSNAVNAFDNRFRMRVHNPCGIGHAAARAHHDRQSNIQQRLQHCWRGCDQIGVGFGLVIFDNLACLRSNQCCSSWRHNISTSKPTKVIF